MGPNESVTSYVNRLRDSFNNLNRQVQKQHVQPVEALQIGIYYRGLRSEILKLQRIGQDCKPMQQSVDRAQRSAASLAAVDGTVSAMSWSTVAASLPRRQLWDCCPFAGFSFSDGGVETHRDGFCA